MSKLIDVAIIGSGPYGLSLAVYLQKKKVDVAIFGKAMGTWRHQMPASMSLKSEGFASNLYHPDGLFTLREFCAENGIEYADMGVPVQLSTFSAYGLAFQKKFVPFLNENLVVDLVKTATGFHLTLENGDTVEARRVVVAAGITHFKYLPPVLAELPPQYVSHSSRHHRMDHLKERDVVVVGAGSSAIDVAVTLHDAGARAQIITRRASIPFHGKAPLKRPLMTRLRAPWSGLGPSWRSRLACDLPLLFHIMPADFRERVVRKHLGPAAGWSTREKIESNVALHLSSSLVAASVQDQKVHLQLRDANNETREVVADHVIAGTGYKVDLLRLPFLGQSLFNDIQLEQTSPVLSSNFESTVPGLYFIGTCAALSFGPLLRFTFGAGFTSHGFPGILHRVAAVALDRARTIKRVTLQRQSNQLFIYLIYSSVIVSAERRSVLRGGCMSTRLRRRALMRSVFST